MKYRSIISLLSLVLVFSACHYSDDGISGNGPVVSEVRVVDTFSSISSSLPANIFISQDPEQSLRIETHANIMPLVQTNVVNGELILELSGSIRNLNRFSIYISAADYERIRLSGAANIRSEGCLAVDDLDVRLSGAGNINLCGEVDNLSVRISGAGNFQSYDMIAQEVNAVVSGAGNMRVTAEQILDVTISGAGSIFYRGNPEIFSSISGAGALINAN